MNIVCGEDENKSNSFYINYISIEKETNDLLEKHKHYLSNDLYSGYEKIFDYSISSFKIKDINEFKASYRSISDEDIIRNLIKWVKYLPYPKHNKIMLKLFRDSYHKYGDHIRKIVDSDYVYSRIRNPTKRMLWFIFEEWVNETVEKTYYDENRFNGILYDIFKFINDNEILFKTCTF